jgi:hypothetical protein
VAARLNSQERNRDRFSLLR